LLGSAAPGTVRLRMSTQEFYIRAENDTEARGPFTQDQLASLVEAEQVSPDTLYYDAAVEQWVAVSSNAGLMAFLFPEKKRLKVRPKEDVATLNVQNASDAPIRVEDMLAAAEGKTVDTMGRGDPKLAAARVAAIARYSLLLMFLLSAFATLCAPLPGKPDESGLFLLLDPIVRWKDLVTDPFMICGIVDLVFVIALLLGATSFYPVVRLRALLALGFFAVFCFLSGEYLVLGAIIAGSAGAYLTTISITWAPLIPGVTVGLAGMAALAYLRVFA
jgi:hypothetical protein